MRILIVKTSSLGDVIHTLPAVTDLMQAIPNAEIDWAVEKAFAFIPAWHPAVRRVIPVELRKWLFWQAITAVRQESYDLIIDAQGLVKSALLAFFAKGKRYGLDVQSVREPVVVPLYHEKVRVAKGQHAITRVRQLFARAFNYREPVGLPNYGIGNKTASKPYLVFLHGTTWTTKLWPETYWQELVKLATKENYEVLLPWADEVEKQRAKAMGGTVLPKLSLEEVANIIARAKGVVTVDTGLGHLAVALNIPTVSLYGPTDPKLTGTYGEREITLAAKTPVCAPCLSRVCRYQGPSNVFPACFENTRPQAVWEKLCALI